MCESQSRCAIDVFYTYATLQCTWGGPNPNIATGYGFYAAAILKGCDEGHETETGVSNDIDVKKKSMGADNTLSSGVQASGDWALSQDVRTEY